MNRYLCRAGGCMYNKTSKKKIVCVFTPTYNRAYRLPKLYESLCRQTDDSFEWLIVDDGSTDNTKQVVDEWIKEKKISIRYFWQENGGKQRAHNLGVEKCNQELFMCVDSDDYISDDCVEQHIKMWEAIKLDETIAGIVSLKGDLEGNPLGTYFPEGLTRTTWGDLYSKYKFRGDATQVYRTSILKKYPYWVADGEKFIGEGYVFYQIDQKYEMILLPKILMYCEYLPDGYSKNVRKLMKNNPKSYMKLKDQTIRFSKNWKERYIQTILFLAACIVCKEPHPIKIAPYKWLAAFAYLPAWLVWLIFYRNA